MLILECEPGDGIIHIDLGKDGRLGLKSNDRRMLKVAKALAEMTEAEFEALVHKTVDQRLRVWLTQLMDAFTSTGEEDTAAFKPEFAESLKRSIAKLRRETWHTSDHFVRATVNKSAVGRSVITESSCARICSYVVKTDTGLAPNPFWGYCTLAVCTPNHQGILARQGDWIVGVTGASRGHKLVYAMQLTEGPLHFDAYFNDGRFQQKKPVMSGDWRQRCGDNMYHRRDGKWEQCASPFHDSRHIERDTRHPYVFISTDFYYFGREAAEVPEEFAGILKRGRGCRWHKSLVCDQLLSWLQQSFASGIHAASFDKAIDCRPCT